MPTSRTLATSLVIAFGLASLAGAQNQNTQLSVAGIPIGARLRGDLYAFVVPELTQNADLDGDGDVQSWVLHVIAGENGAIENLHLPVPVIGTPFQTPPFQMSDRLVAFLVVESELNAIANPTGTDLNGDGDVLDRVVHVYDRVTHQVHDTFLGGVSLPGGLAVEGDTVVMAVDESAQNVDLDGDGLLTHTVACTWTVPGGVVSLARPAKVHPGRSSSVGIAGGRAYFLENESVSLIDKNADGDTNDSVLQEVNLATYVTTNLALDADDLKSSANMLAFRVGEAAQGNADRNGDGDVNDRVECLRIPRLNSTRDLRCAVKTDTQGRTYTTVSGFLVAMRVAEQAFPPVDLNGDGDTQDVVLFVHDARANLTRNTQRAVPDDTHVGGQPFLIAGDSILFAGSEYYAGQTDFNGDGDALDAVAQLYLSSTGAILDLGVAVPNAIDGGLRASSTWLTMCVGEIEQGNVDLNANGILGDHVLFAFDRLSGSLTNLGISVAEEADVVLSGRDVLFTTGEYVTGDANGDGDTSDTVVHRRDGATGIVTNVGLAVGSNSSQPSVLGIGSRGLVTVAEFANGAVDHNGDGDVFDGVLHFVPF